MKSLLVIRGGAIGDFILTLPALHAVRDQHPSARLEIMGYPHIAELVVGRFYAAAARSMDHRAMAGFFAAEAALDKGLCEYFASFELVVSYLYDPDGILEANLKRAGVRRLIKADGRPSGIGHASEFLSHWLPETGITARLAAPRLYPSDKDRAEASRLLATVRRPMVALHIGSGSRLKNWPIGRFLGLADWLKTRRYGVMVVEGPADSESESLFWKDPSSIDCMRCHSQPLPVLAAALQQCAAFVGHDSGISHLSAAVGAPTIAIFGMTDPQRWGPRGKSVAILQRGAGVAAVSLDDVKTSLEPHLEKSDGVGP